jgi:hypothetical protein
VSPVVSVADFYPWFSFENSAVPFTHIPVPPPAKSPPFPLRLDPNQYPAHRGLANQRRGRTLRVHELHERVLLGSVIRFLILGNPEGHAVVAVFQRPVHLKRVH